MPFEDALRRERGPRHQRCWSWSAQGWRFCLLLEGGGRVQLKERTALHITVATEQRVFNCGWVGMGCLWIVTHTQRVYILTRIKTYKVIQGAAHQRPRLPRLHTSVKLRDTRFNGAEFIPGSIWGVNRDNITTSGRPAPRRANPFGTFPGTRVDIAPWWGYPLASGKVPNTD